MNELINRYRLFEILIIVIFSVAIGLAYNYSLPKPLPLIYEKKTIASLDDKLLFDDKTNSNDISNLDKTVSFEQMVKISESNSDEFVIVDARQPEMWNKSKIGNSVNIFPYADESEVMNKILDLPQGKKIVIYCDGGNCDSSHKIAEIMKNFGFEKVFIYSGGWDEWTKMKGIN